MLLFNEATLQFHRKLGVLLLARSAGEWWAMVRSTSDEHSRLLHHPTRFLRLFLQEPVQDPTETEVLFNEARRHFAIKSVTRKRAIRLTGNIQR